MVFDPSLRDEPCAECYDARIAEEREDEPRETLDETRAKLS